MHHWQLPDGVRTNGIVAEVPQFPLMNFHRKICAKCYDMLQKVTTCNVLQQVCTTRNSDNREFVGLL